MLNLIKCTIQYKITLYIEIKRIKQNEKRERCSKVDWLISAGSGGMKSSDDIWCFYSTEFFSSKPVPETLLLRPRSSPVLHSGERTFTNTQTSRQKKRRKQKENLALPLAFASVIFSFFRVSQILSPPRNFLPKPLQIAATPLPPLLSPKRYPFSVMLKTLYTNISTTSLTNLYQIEQWIFKDLISSLRQNTKICNSGNVSMHLQNMIWKKRK